MVATNERRQLILEALSVRRFETVQNLATEFDVSIRTIKYDIKDNEVDLSSLIDWVNIIWFTDLFEYSDSESDSIASVMTVLETLDEEGVCITDEDYDKMSMCLTQNIEYEQQV